MDHSFHSSADILFHITAILPENNIKLCIIQEPIETALIKKHQNPREHVRKRCDYMILIEFLEKGWIEFIDIILIGLDHIQEKPLLMRIEKIERPLRDIRKMDKLINGCPSHSIAHQALSSCFHQRQTDILSFFFCVFLRHISSF